MVNRVKTEREETLQPVTRRDLDEEFRRLGLGRVRAVEVHSPLSSLGHVVSGAGMIAWGHEAEKHSSGYGLDTVSLADLIAVLDGGRVVEPVVRCKARECDMLCAGKRATDDTCLESPWSP